MGLDKKFKEIEFNNKTLEEKFEAFNREQKKAAFMSAFFFSFAASYTITIALLSKFAKK